jgi:signal transduction protein with GAF and PtsI domain
MMNQILAQSKAVNKHKRTFKIAYLSLAASLLLISGLFFTNILSKRTSAPKADFSSISEDDIIQYIDADDLNNSHVEPLTDASVETYLISTDENLLIDPL